MKINMKRLPLFGSIAQIEKFLNTNKSTGFKFEIISTKNKYEFINGTLWHVRYHRLSRKEKHSVLKYLNFFTRYSISHLKRLAYKWRNGTLAYNPIRKRNKFAKKYFPSDIALLIETDVVHDCLSGEATRRILKREFEKFGRIEYGNISHISSAHIYNVRNKNLQYSSSPAKFLKRTQATQVNIGIRKKPEPNGEPGYLRVDTVHQGDFNGKKGVYHINIVDEVTQYELIGTVELITERYLKPVVKELLKLFPFIIYEFHADNGSEYINRYTVELLNKLHIELTKTRSRHTNDNALVESKNGSIIRKFYGRNYIDQKWAKRINQFNRQYVNIYLNYHRPCGFATTTIDRKGKEKKIYPQSRYQIPYERLKRLTGVEKYLKNGVTFKELDKIAYEKSDNQFAKEMQREKSRLFKMISRDNIYRRNKQKFL